MNRSHFPDRLSIQCPRCGQLVSNDANACLHCKLPRPGLYSRIPVVGELLRGEVTFTNHIILICFVLYGLSIVLDMSNTVWMSGLFDSLAPSSQSLYKLGMGGTIALYNGRWWSLITANYLHGGILHIAFNMLWLRSLGALVEDLFGPSRFWIIYTVSGLIGSLASAVAGTPLSVGASGAIFGLFGALIFYGRHRGGTFGSGIFRQMLLWAGIGFLFGLAMPNVDNWGHVGGFVGGLLTAIILGYNERGRTRFWQHILAAVFLVFVGVCFSFMFVTFFR